MKITEVRISRCADDKLKAYVTITLNHCFVVRGLKVIRGNRGMFVAMPSRRRPDGTYQDLCHPRNASTRAWLEEAILERYRSELERTARVE